MTHMQSNISMSECFKTLKELCNKETVYVDDIPAPLKADFDSFIVGKTLSSQEGKVITHDIKEYYNKVYYGSGINYPIIFNKL